MIGERRRAKAALASAKTFSELAEDYMLRAGPSLKYESRQEVRRYLDKDLVPRLGRLRIEEITGAEIVTAIEQIGKRSAYVAHRSFEILSQVFKHALAKHLAKSNPCAGLSASAVVGKKQRVREPVKLSEADLRALFTKLPTIGRANALAVKMLLAAGTRKMELVGARWENVDLEQGLWRIPEEDAKNGQPSPYPCPRCWCAGFRS